MLYYLILGLQGFCIYHLIKNRNEYYWLFLIIFIPVIGCVIYLVTQVYNKRDANKLQENLTAILVPTKKVNDLKKKLEFANTYQNRVNLADAYVEMKDYENAILHYKEALKDTSQNDFHCLEQLVSCYYHTENYELSISTAQKINTHIDFAKSEAQFNYALALKNAGELDKAEAELRKVDQRYSNYSKRLVLAKFLIERNKIEGAKAILTEMSRESQHMKPKNKRLHRATFTEVAHLLQTA